MIGKREFELMKTEAFFINTAFGYSGKGRVVDEKALIDALDSGKIAGAAVDCFETQAGVPNPLLKMGNVIVTPEWAYEVNSLNRDLCIAEDIVKVLKGKRPTHIANPKAWDIFLKRNI